MNIEPLSRTAYYFSVFEPTGTVSPVDHECCTDKTNRFWFKLIVAGLVLIVIAVLIMAAVPPTSRDALSHHLAIPKLWIKSGSIAPMPQFTFSYYPMNIDLLYVIPIVFGNDIIPKYIHFLFAVATAGLIYSYLKLRANPTMSLLGALLFLSTPIIVKLSINAYVDLGLVFFSWASIYYLFAWARSLPSTKHLVFSAIFCGLGIGTKYNGMIVLFLMTLFVALIYNRSVDQKHYRPIRVIGYPVIFFLVAMTIFSPWMIRNYRLTGNPVYPLYRDRIGSQTVTAEMTNMSMKPWLQRKLIYHETLLETGLIPLRIFFQGQDDNPQFFDGRLNPALCLFPFLLLLKRRKTDGPLKVEQNLLGAYAILFLLVASFMVDMRIRYIAPTIPPLVVLTIFGIINALDWVNNFDRKTVQKWCRLAIMVTIFFFLSFNATYIFALFVSVDPLPYIVGESSREEYLANKLPDYPAIQFANQIKSDNMKILALFLGNRLYFFDRPVEFRTQAFADMVEETTDTRDLNTRLQDDGFSHCIIGIQNFESWVNRVFTDNQKKNIVQWLRNDCIQLFSQNGYVVYRFNPNGVSQIPAHQKGIAQINVQK
jgi:hypothetical protein